MEPREARQERKAALIARRAEVAIEKAREKAEREAQARAEAERLEAERRETARVARVAFDAYQHVRGRLERMRHGSAAVTLTAAERETAAALEHLWTASPDTIAQLRRWCEPVGGARPADYDAPSPELTVRLKRDHRVLRRQVGAELFVPEPQVLGAFGAWRDGDFYNEDTIRGFSALVALQDGAVLDTCRRAAARRLVWDIGGGWGGFAHQFKTICPNVTYLITGMPETFLLSAVYLMTLFPHARFRFYGDAPADDLWTGWDTTDFFFVPEGALSGVRPPRLDLVLDLATLRFMDAARIDLHVRRAYDWGAPYFYSLLPAGSPAEVIETLWGGIARAFWPHPVPPRAENIPPVVDGPAAPVPGVEYTHLIGWRRLRA